MKITTVLFLLFMQALPLAAQRKPAANTNLPRPRLVVGLVIDQMRWDYLYRYYDRYGADGFKRMLIEGFSCDNAYIDYIPTVTAIGHSTVYTGSVPAIHGIAGNDFIVQATGKSLYCTEDSTVQTVGSTSTAGKMSPRNLWSTTITDELKLATNFRSKVIGISLKDRGGILPAGHTANAAYWFDDQSGNWITSTYYMKELPAWVKRFNEQKLPEKYLKQDWAPLFGTETYVQSAPDNNAYEGKFSGTDAPTLPVKTSGMFSKGFGIIRTTPYGNTLTFDLAKAAIENENLGGGADTDFLAVSCSSPDYIGHRFSVNSVEVEDTYLRLDRDIADFLKYLDNKVGKGNYTIFLTADHAAAHNPNFLIDAKVPGGIWRGSAAMQELNKALAAKYQTENLVISFMNYQIHLNNRLIEQNKLDAEAIKRDCIKFMKGKPGIHYVVDMEQAQIAAVPEMLRQRIINGYNLERSGVIQLILKPSWSSNTTGTSHGAWNAYDAHIPLLWMGWGIQKGHTDKPVYMTDIAATLASLLRIQVPNGNIGQPIAEVLK